LRNLALEFLKQNRMFNLICFLLLYFFRLNVINEVCCLNIFSVDAKLSCFDHSIHTTLYAHLFRLQLFSIDAKLLGFDDCIHTALNGLAFNNLLSFLFFSIDSKLVCLNHCINAVFRCLNDNRNSLLYGFCLTSYDLKFHLYKTLSRFVFYL